MRWCVDAVSFSCASSFLVLFNLYLDSNYMLYHQPWERGCTDKQFGLDFARFFFTGIARTCTQYMVLFWRLKVRLLLLQQGHACVGIANVVSYFLCSISVCMPLLDVVFQFVCLCWM